MKYMSSQQYLGGYLSHFSGRFGKKFQRKKIEFQIAHKKMKQQKKSCQLFSIVTVCNNIFLNFNCTPYHYVLTINRNQFVQVNKKQR